MPFGTPLVLSHRGRSLVNEEVPFSLGSFSYRVWGEALCSHCATTCLRRNSTPGYS